MDNPTWQDWIDHLALMLAKRRTGGSVYMDGRHNPLPSEIQEATTFVEDFTEWLTS